MRIIIIKHAHMLTIGAMLLVKMSDKKIFFYFSSPLAKFNQ